MKRKLVTYRQVAELLPIKDADKIELAKIDGWQCIVSKGQFKVGDYGLFFEIDSFLPIEDRYEFLRKSSYRKLQDSREGFRIKTIRMKGVLSQGLLMPLAQFPELNDASEFSDLEDILKVVKYEAQSLISFKGNAKGSFPSFIRITNEERIQNLTRFRSQYKEYEYEVTEKIDGSSLTVYLNEGIFGICSHRVDLKVDDDNIFCNFINATNLKEKLVSINRNIAIQGELAGPGIQKNRLKLNKLGFYIFNIWDINKQSYLTGAERFALLESFDVLSAPIFHVPCKHLSFIPRMFDTIEDWLEASNIMSLLNSSCRAEGLVYKTTDLINGEIVSFKVINNYYLLEEKD